MSKDKHSPATGAPDSVPASPKVDKPEPTHWSVKLDGNPEIVVPTAEQEARGQVARSESEAWALYAQHCGITSSVHQFSASPIEPAAAG